MALTFNPFTGQLDFTGGASGSPGPLVDLDASSNPNYPVALKGDRYRITVAGKVGGASGKVVEAGDVVEALANNAGGTEAAVGTNWIVLQANIAGMTAAGLSMITAADAAAQAALLTALLAKAGGTMTGALVNSANGAASTPAISVTGTLFTGGSATTTVPLLNFLPSGTSASTAWSTSGTFFGINAASGFAGDFFNFKLNNSLRASMSSSGALTLNSTLAAPQLALSVDTGYIQFGTKAYIQGSATDGVIGIYNNAGTSFSRLQFGGTTSSFPSLKRSSAQIHCRVADDSAYAQFDALGYSVGGAAGANFGPGLPTSITVVNGIITAAS